MRQVDGIDFYEEDLYKCIRCGFCRAVCPVLQEEDKNEIVGPRSFVLVAKGILTGGLKPSPTMAQRTYRCVACGACNLKCPPGVRIEEVVMSTRHRLIESRIQPPHTFTSLFNAITRNGRLYHDEELPYDVLSKIPVKEKADVILFAGCVATHWEQGQVEAMMRILQKADVDYTMLKGEECCGLPLLIHGYVREFRERVEKTFKAIKRVDASTLVTPCPGCYRAFTQLYPDGLTHHTILHSSQFIKELIKNGKLQFRQHAPAKVTYHDPCDLGRHVGVYDPPREVIRSVPNIDLVEARRVRGEAQCCGGRMGFASAYQETARNICATRLRQDLESRGAEILVTSCPSCVHHFKATQTSLPPTDFRMRILDLTELVAESLSEEAP